MPLCITCPQCHAVAEVAELSPALTCTRCSHYLSDNPNRPYYPAQELLDCAPQFDETPWHDNAWQRASRGALVSVIVGLSGGHAIVLGCTPWRETPVLSIIFVLLWGGAGALCGGAIGALFGPRSGAASPFLYAPLAGSLVGALAGLTWGLLGGYEPLGTGWLAGTFGLCLGAGGGLVVGVAAAMQRVRSDSPLQGSNGTPLGGGLFDLVPSDEVIDDLFSN